MDEVGEEEEPLVGLYIDYDDRNLLDTGGDVPPPPIALFESGLGHLLFALSGVSGAFLNALPLFCV